MSQPTPDDVSSQRINDVLTAEFGPHGAWVLGIETFDPDTGVTSLSVRTSPDANTWTQHGIASALTALTSDWLTEGWERDE